MQLTATLLVALVVHGHVAAATPTGPRPGQLETAGAPQRRAIAQGFVHEKRELLAVPRPLARRGGEDPAGEAPAPPSSGAAEGKKRKQEPLAETFDEKYQTKKQRENANQRKLDFRARQKQREQEALAEGGPAAEAMKAAKEEEKKKNRESLRQWRANRKAEAASGDGKAQASMAKDKEQKRTSKAQTLQKLKDAAAAEEAAGKPGEATKKLEAHRASNREVTQRLRKRPDELVGQDFIPGREDEGDPTATTAFDWPSAVPDEGSKPATTMPDSPKMPGYGSD